MNIQFEDANEEMHDIEVTIVKMSSEDPTDLKLSVGDLPKGIKQSDVKDHAISFYMDDMIEEFQNEKRWKREGMEFHHYN